MYLAWIIPCALGVVVYLAMAFIPMEKVPGMLTACVYNFGVAMLTIRSIFIGVIEIYGTTNSAMLTTYTVLSIVFLSIGGAAYLGFFIYAIIKLIKKRFRKKNEEVY